MLQLNSGRIIYYDYIRAFAIFGVLACHIFARLVIQTQIFNTNLWYYSLLFNSLRDVSVPLFICLSGALLITKKDSLGTFVKKRFNKVIIPYIFWVIIFIISEAKIFKINNLFDFILETISFPPTGHGVIFWFVQMILVVYVIIFVLNKLIEYNKWFLKISLVISVFVIILTNLNIIPLFPNPYGYIYFSIYAIFGYYLATYDFSSNKLIRSLNITNEKFVVIFFILSILLYLCEIYYNASTSISLNSYSAISQFSFVNITLVISVFLVFRYLEESKGKFNKIYNHISNSNLGKTIFSISFCSYGIYLCHIIIRDLIFINLDFQDFLSPSIYTTLLLFCTLICSWLLSLTMSKIPFLKRVSGR